MKKRVASMVVLPGLALLAACGSGAETIQTRATQAASAIPRVTSSAETSRYIVDPPAPADSTALSEAAVRSTFLADAGPGTTIRTIALARFTDKPSLVRLPPITASAPTDPVNPESWRIDHRPAIVVVGNGPPIQAGGVPGPSAPPSNELVIAAFDPVGGQLIAEGWTPDETVSLSVARA